MKSMERTGIFIFDVISNFDLDTSILNKSMQFHHHCKDCGGLGICTRNATNAVGESVGYGGREQEIGNITSEPL